MSTAVVESRFLTTANVLAGSLPLHLPQANAGLFLYFDVPTFQLQLKIPVTDIESNMESGSVVFKTAIGDYATLILTVSGKVNAEEGGFKIRRVNLHMERETETASADFIISTLRAALVLADEIHLRIPEGRIDLTLRFDAPLLEISEMLRRRQINYRVMVIERTIRHEFHLPHDISEDEVRDIALAYHAIVDRSFVWPIDSITIFFPAIKEWSDTLVRLRQETSIPIGPDPFSLELFGHKIELGQRGIIIKDAVIEDFETAHEELSKDDRHSVPVVIRSTSGQARYDFFGAPEPPANMWDSNIQKIVELESQLDAAIVDRYHTLAASTLEGLTEEEKIAITVRPELDELPF